MVVDKGYKQTEVGIIPEDWQLQRLGDLSKKIGDGIHTTPIYDENGEYYFVNGNNLINGAIVASEGTKKVNKFEYLSHKRELDNTTLLISINGTIGNVAFYKNEKIVLGKSAAYINLNGALDKRYLYQLIQTESINKYFENELTGSTIKNLGLGSIRNTPIPLPPLPEQTAIANALSDMDALIAQTEKLIEKKKAIKQGVMQELLKPKEGWVTKKLGDYGKTYGGITGKTKSDFGKGNGKYIPFMNIMSNPIIDIGYLDKVDIKSSESQNRAIKGDLFFNGSSETPEEVGLCSVLTEELDNLYLNSFCFGYRMNNQNDLNGLFLSYLFRSPLGRNLIFSLAQGATRYNLSKTNLLKLELPIPSKKEQDIIALTLQDLDRSITATQTKLTKLKHQKQGMMQALLTGKIRLV